MPFPHTPPLWRCYGARTMWQYGTIGKGGHRGDARDARKSPMPFYTGIAAVLNAGVAVILILALAVLEGSGYNRGLTLGNPLSRTHYVIQISGYCTFIHAVLAHRVYQSFGRLFCKRIHAASHICCLILLCSGVIIRVVAKDRDAYAENTYESNMYTLYCFLGACSLAVYLLMSLFVYRRSRSSYIRFSNIYRASSRDRQSTVIATAFAAVVSAGVQQLFTRGWMCILTRGPPNSNPAAVYSTMGAGCRLVNGAGILIYLACILAALTVSLSVTKLR